MTHTYSIYLRPVLVPISYTFINLFKTTQSSDRLKFCKDHPRLRNLALVLLSIYHLNRSVRHTWIILCCTSSLPQK